MGLPAFASSWILLGLLSGRKSIVSKTFRFSPHFDTRVLMLALRRATGQAARRAAPLSVWQTGIKPAMVPPGSTVVC